MLIAELIQPLNQALSSIALSLPRLLTCFLLVPVFSGRQLHGLLRMAVGIGVGMPVAAGLYYQQAVGDFSMWAMLGLYLKEAAIGLLLGFFLATPFWIFESIGTLFDTQRGALMGQQLNPETGDMSSVMGLLLQQSAIILMIQVGAFAWLFGLLVDSFIFWPATAWLPDFSDDAAPILVSQAGHLISSFVLYALPLMMVLASIELIFALVGVYSPQLQVYFLAMPAKSLVGLMVFVLYAKVLWHHGETEFLLMKEVNHILLNLLPAPFSAR